MIGASIKQSELQLAPINLFDQIPARHIVRRLNQVLDLSFVRKKVASFYGRNGQEGVDPAVIMKMMLLLFIDDHKSERQLVREIPVRIDYLYFIGIELGQVIPNHSVLSKARKRWGVEVFEELFKLTI